MQYKKLPAIIFFVCIATSVGATHNMTYFVYVETHFVQGYWDLAPMVYESGDRYLYPHTYTDLFGTVKVDFYNKLLKRLGEHHDFYSSVSLDSNKLKRVGYREFYDTLNFAVQAGLNAGQIKTVKNELTTTVLNAGSCRAIRLKFYRNGDLENTETYNMNDLDYPVFKLVDIGEGKQRPTRIVERRVHDTVYQVKTDTVIRKKPEETDQKTEQASKKRNRGACWDHYLWIGIILILLALLIQERRKRPSS